MNTSQQQSAIISDSSRAPIDRNLSTNGVGATSGRVGTVALVTAAVVVIAVPSLPAAAPPVAVLEMPVVVEPGSEADAINNAGTLGGWTDSGPTLMPVLVDAFGNLNVLPIFAGATDGQVVAVNDFTEAIGHCLFCPFEGDRMFWPGDGTVVRVPLYLDEFEVILYDLNNSGLAVGGHRQNIGEGDIQPLMWNGHTGEFTLLPTFDPDGRLYGFVRAVNDAALAVGSTNRPGESITRAVVWEDGEIRQLPHAPYVAAEWATDINDEGVIIGVVYGAKSSGQSIAVWTPGADEVIALPDRWDRGESYPQAINNRGIVIGTSRQQQSDNVNYYVWYSWYEQPLLIDNLFPPRHNWFDIKIWDINDANQIAGSGRKYGEPFGFVITPVTYSFRIRAAYPGRAGEVNAVQIEGAPPDTTIHLVAGTIGGGRYIPGCNSQQNALQIDNPQLVQSVITDATGHAVVRGRLPGSFAGQTLLLQAVIPGECAISNLIEQTFE